MQTILSNMSKHKYDVFLLEFSLILTHICMLFQIISFGCYFSFKILYNKNIKNI